MTFCFPLHKLMKHKKMQGEMEEMVERDRNGWMEPVREGERVRKGGKEREIKWSERAVKGESNFGKSN